jgi:hypothetical protein
MSVYVGNRVTLSRALELIGAVPGVQSALEELTLALRHCGVRWWGKDSRGTKAEISPEQSARLHGLLPSENVALFDRGPDIDDLLGRNWRRDHIEVDLRDLERIWKVQITASAAQSEAPQGARAGHSSARAETLCREWLKGIASSTGGVAKLAQPGRARWKAEAISMPTLRGLSRRGFDRAWSAVAEQYPEISRAGAKPRNRITSPK